jgi:catechol 2,3-dioxygenase-like lactoylglutathione lyase family enzyme
MSDASIVILPVANPAASARFYADLLGREAIDASATFVLMPISPALRLGLWKADAMVPAAAPAGGSEIGFLVGDAAAVDAVHAEWRAKGATIAMPPTDLDFGRSFVAHDPDGHRLRVYALADAA